MIRIIAGLLLVFSSDNLAAPVCVAALLISRQF